MTGNINCIGDGELLFLDTFSHENTTVCNIAQCFIRTLNRNPRCV